MFTLLRYRCLAAAQSLTHSVDLAFGPKSGFRHKCQVRDCDFGFRLKIKARLRIWIVGRLHLDKGLHFCFMAEFNIACVF